MNANELFRFLQDAYNRLDNLALSETDLIDATIFEINHYNLLINDLVKTSRKKFN